MVVHSIKVTAINAKGNHHHKKNRLGIYTKAVITKGNYLN
tara:strand:- start:45959 stop:46078 length:120 start_codon:yes stop_codon:yes gene_type:complete